MPRQRIISQAVRLVAIFVPGDEVVNVPAFIRLPFQPFDVISVAAESYHLLGDFSAFASFLAEESFFFFVHSYFCLDFRSQVDTLAPG